MHSGTGFLAADLEETDDAFFVETELPGVDRKDIDVELAGRRLIVSGERKESERVGVLRCRTRSLGLFPCEVVFPTGVTDEEVDVAYRDGVVLRLSVPKAVSGKSRKVESK